VSDSVWVPVLGEDSAFFAWWVDAWVLGCAGRVIFRGGSRMVTRGRWGEGGVVAC